MLLALSAALALAAAPPPIVNGAETADWPSVGAMFADNGIGIGVVFCSATLIHPEWALTAAHCVDDLETFSDAGYPYPYLILGADAGDGEIARVAVDELIRHPDYDLDTISHDVALLRLSEPVDAAAPAALWAPSLSALAGGEPVTLVGWGDLSGDQPGTGGVARAVDVAFDELGDDRFFAASDDGGAACSGDSGGAALLWDGADARLAGVISYSSTAEGEAICEGRTASARLDVHLDWIAGYVDLSEGDTGGEGDDTGDPSGDDTETADDTGGSGASDTGGGEAPGGCGCAAGAGGVSAGYWALGLLAVFSGRRRPRRRA